MPAIPFGRTQQHAASRQGLTDMVLVWSPVKRDVTFSMMGSKIRVRGPDSCARNYQSNGGGAGKNQADV